MKSNWKLFETNKRLQEDFSKVLGVSPFLAQILLNRGIMTHGEARDFLFGDLASCHDPFKMKDMEKAVERIFKAIKLGEKILIYGDYDVDGVTAVAVLQDVLDRLGARYETFIPNRIEEGYGLNIRAVALAAHNGVKLLVTVDCGINSIEEIKAANSHGIDVIVTDHHEVRSKDMPPAYAIIDAHQRDCDYPFKFLSGVGVAYKLGTALLSKVMCGANMEEHLDLVALGTVADVVPLNGENRVLVKMGLKHLKNTKKIGLKALMEVSGLEAPKLTCRHIAFVLAPRINAMGRTGSANTALELLNCKDASRADELAMALDRENKNRQDIEKDILKDVFERLDGKIDLSETGAIVLSDEAWHPGVIGIVASRVAEEFNRPSILIAVEGENGKGSARGITGFNLFEAIGKTEPYLVNYGGHASACGIKIKKDNIKFFAEEFNRISKVYLENKETREAELKIDLSMPFSHVGVKLIEELKLLMPHGPGNSEPVFCTASVKVKSAPRDIGRNGFKFLVSAGNLTCEAITFRKGNFAKPKSGDTLDLVYSPSINSWQGIDSVQLNIKDFHVID